MIFFSFCKISHIYEDIAILKRNLRTDYSNAPEFPESARTQCDVTVSLPKAYSRVIRDVRCFFIQLALYNHLKHEQEYNNELSVVFCADVQKYDEKCTQ